MNLKNLERMIWFVLLVGAVALIRDTVAQGQDFIVFWKTAGYVLDGQPAYSIARDGAMTFKYPPWILPFFFPLTLLPLTAAKWVWGMLQVSCLYYIARSLSSSGVSKWAIYFCLISYWGIWAVHALDGQVNLIILAAIVLAFSGFKIASITLWPWIQTVIALSTKVFTLFALGFFLRSERKGFLLGYSLVGLVMISLLSLPAFLGSVDRDPAQFLKGWAETASSGGTQFAGSKVRGRDNQGLPAMILRKAEVPPEETKLDLIVFAVMASFMGLMWLGLSKRFSFEVQWLGWLALIPVVHPLSWFHLFIFSFPFATYAVWSCFRNGPRSAAIMSVLGVLITTAVTEKTLGSFGLYLESFSIKSIGVILIFVAFFSKYRKPLV